MVGVIVTFVVVALLLSVLPGPDTLLVLRAGLRGGRRYGTATGLGCAAGSLIWGCAAAVGLATLLERSAAAFEVVKLAGAVYLIILGIRALRDARRLGGLGGLGVDEAGPGGPPAQGPAGAFLAGLTNDLLNPKMGLFYVAVIPQVVPHTMPIMNGTLMFAGIDTAVAAMYLAVLAAVTGWALRWLRQARVRRAMESTTGLCMVGLGATIALDHSL